MAPTMRALLCVTIVLIITALSAFHVLRYSDYFARQPVEAAYATTSDAPYTYESKFSLGDIGVLNTSYWVADPQLVSGTHYIENGMLRIESNNRYQVGFGMKWKSPTYEKGDWETWLPLYWKYRAVATFIRPEGELPFLVVENWIAWEAGQSETAMVWYQHGNLMYSYGGFPDDHSYGIILDRFDLPREFNVTVNADYQAKSITIDWSNHRHSLPLQLERVGNVAKPFTHFQITLMEPGTICLKSLKVTLTN